MQLVLSLFPGWDLLGKAFRTEGFAVVSGGDYIFGDDIRNEHFPPGRFDGVIGGPPCQAFSKLAHMVRQNGYEPKFGNLIPEFERVCFEVQPNWFLMEEVPGAPIPQVEGYEVWSTLLNNRQLGEAQNRVRRFSFGSRERTPLMIDVVALESPEFLYCNGEDATRTKRTKMGRMPWNHKGRTGLRESLRAAGLPEAFEFPGVTIAAQCKAIRNGVPIPMGRAIARAVLEATQPPGATT